MKKLLTLVLLIASTTLMFSQDDADQMTAEYPVGGDTEFGLFAGINSGFITENGFTPADGTSTVYRIGFGAHADYYFSKTWSIRARVNYDTRGFKDDATDAKLNANYLSIPIMANWHFGKRKRWYLHFGPFIAFNLSADIEGTDVKDQLDSTEFGSAIGIGVKIPVGDKYIFIESDGLNDFTGPSDLEEDKFVRSSLNVGIIF